MLSDILAQLFSKTTLDKVYLINDPSKIITSPTRRPNRVTEVRMDNTVLTISGYFKQDTTTDKMAKVLEANNTSQPGQIFLDLAILCFFL